MQSHTSLLYPSAFTIIVHSAKAFADRPVDELGEHIGHPRQGIDVVQLASFDQRSSDCPILRTDE
jgi:hypothetical protein